MRREQIDGAWQHNPSWLPCSKRKCNFLDPSRICFKIRLPLLYVDNRDPWLIFTRVPFCPFGVLGLKPGSKRLTSKAPITYDVLPPSGGAQLQQRRNGLRPSTKCSIVWPASRKVQDRCESAGLLISLRSGTSEQKTQLANKKRFMKWALGAYIHSLSHILFLLIEWDFLGWTAFSRGKKKIIFGNEICPNNNNE